MSPIYEESQPGPLQQGEILAGVWELRPMHPASKPAPNTNPPVVPIPHDLVVVLTAACDLEQDYRIRFPADTEPLTPEDIDSQRRSLQYVLLCDLYRESEIRPQLPESWKRVSQNQEQRYHRLFGGPIADSERAIPEPLYLDFLKAVALPAEALYLALDAKSISRVAVVPHIHVHDLIQRFFSFLSRVGLPDEPALSPPPGSDP